MKPSMKALARSLAPIAAAGERRFTPEIHLIYT
jgi:hypothetical protein